MSDFLSLDWRDKLSTSIEHQVLQFLTGLDSEGYALLRLESSAYRKIVTLEQVDGVYMVRRSMKTTKRQFSTQVEYYRRLWHIAVSLVAMQTCSKPLKSKFVTYKEADQRKDVGLPMVRQLSVDLALSIGVHPAVFGLIPEDKGLVFLPKGLVIEATTITNIIAYRKMDSAEVKDYKKHQKVIKLNAGKQQQIPTLIESLKAIVPKRKKPLGVVVVEHRNMTTMMIEDGYPIEKVIIVMTAGYPTNATCEFLHMLSEDPFCKTLPFLYLSDHDMQGVQIYQCLKYGARNKAYASQIMVCPQLKWVGPTREQLVQSTSAFRTSWEAQYKSDRPHATTDEIQAAHQKWKTKTDAQIKGRLVPYSRVDVAFLSGFERLGWLDLEDEALLKSEVTEMFERASKFRFADISSPSLNYVEMFIREQIQAQCNKVVQRQTKKVAN